MGPRRPLASPQCLFPLDAQLLAQPQSDTADWWARCCRRMKLAAALLLLAATAMAARDLQAATYPILDDYQRALRGQWLRKGREAMQKGWEEGAWVGCVVLAPVAGCLHQCPLGIFLPALIPAPPTTSQPSPASPLLGLRS